MSAARRRGARRRWTALSDRELLGLRFCDLDLAIEGTIVEERVNRLYEELQANGIRFRPHCWLSDEWYSPNGVPGIAVPFYLAHPRLMRLEQRQMLEVEGGSLDWCMKILRHEAGHAIDTAFRLHRRGRWREMFGRASQKYPNDYRPRPYSKNYVLHLNFWYAQSHPSEDFAESFAVWLKPGSDWRRRYYGWPVLEKLRYVNRLMGEIARERPALTSRRQVEPVASNRATLGEHYRARRAKYGVDLPKVYDEELRRLFPAPPGSRGGEAASRFLRRLKPELRSLIAEWSGDHMYSVDHALDDVIHRCSRLRLRRTGPLGETTRSATVFLTAHTMLCLRGQRYRITV